MKIEKRKLDVENAFGETAWCTLCVLCPVPPESWVLLATYSFPAPWE